MTRDNTIQDNIKVIKIGKQFKLGFCACGCGAEIPIRDKYHGYMRTFVHNHHQKGEMNSIHKRDISGEKCIFWRGGKRTTMQGYIQILKKDHPRATKGGYIYEHRLVYEQHHNVCLLSWTEIDHINGIKDDNRIENLRAMSKSEHMRRHMIGNKYNPKKDMSNRICKVCNSNKTYVDKKGYSRWKGNEVDGYKCNKCHMKVYNKTYVRPN